MVRKEEADKVGQSGSDSGAAGQFVHPLVMWCLPFNAPAIEQKRSWVDMAGRDVPISVWWDRPPHRGPRR